MLFTAGTALAETDLPFSWTANPVSEKITGYNLYMNGAQVAIVPGADSEAYTFLLVEDTVKQDFTLTAFRDGVFAEESEHSQTATFTPVVIPPDPITPPSKFEIWMEKITQWLKDRGWWRS